jgi:hypothetical protein
MNMRVPVIALGARRCRRAGTDQRRVSRRVRHSITDGVGATLDSNLAWTSLLAAKLAAGHTGPAFGVANAGLSGNRLLTCLSSGDRQGH